MKIDFAAFKFLLKGEFWARLWDEINSDNCWGMAAQLSFYFLLAFFPFLIFLSALVGFVPIDSDLIDALLGEFDTLMPPEAYALVRRIATNLLESRDQGILTIGIAFSLWFASLAFNGMISLLNQAYQVRETRSYFRTRSLAIVVTLIVSVFMILSGVLLFFGDWLISLVAVTPPIRSFYWMLRWILIFFLLNLGVEIIYFALPARRFAWKLISPGGILATLGLVLGSLVFRNYVYQFSGLQQLYGSLAALIGLMVWFFICSFCLVVGGEIDSEIYKMRAGVKPPRPASPAAEDGG